MPRKSTKPIQLWIEPAIYTGPLRETVSNAADGFDAIVHKTEWGTEDSVLHVVEYGAYEHAERMASLLERAAKWFEKYGEAATLEDYAKDFRNWQKGKK